MRASSATTSEYFSSRAAARRGRAAGFSLRSARVARCRSSIAALLGFAVLLLILAAPASAHLTRTAGTLSTFGTPTNPVGLAVDNSSSANSGDVFVPNFGAGGGVFKLNPAGEKIGEIGAGDFINPTDLAVDPANGDIYVSDLSANKLTAFKPSGELIFQVPVPGNTFGVAVNPAKGPHGAVYVADQANGLIHELDAETGAEISQLGAGHVTAGAVQSLAVDGSGNLYAANEGENVVEFNSSGVFQQVLATDHPSAVAVDPSNSRIFVAENDLGGYQIAEYAADPPPSPAPMPSPIDTFGSGDFPVGARVLGLGVAGATNHVYASDFANSNGHIYGPPTLAVPDVTLGEPTNQTRTSTTLNGHVDPDNANGAGPITECDFEYFTPEPRNEVQTLTLSGATGGTFNLIFDETPTPQEIAYDAEAGTVQAELNQIGIDNEIGMEVVVTGPAGGPYTIEFAGVKQGHPPQGNVPQIEVESELLEPPSATAAVVTTTEGENPHPAPVPCLDAANTIVGTSGNPITTPTDVHADLSGLTSEAKYQYQLFATGTHGRTESPVQIFTPHAVVGLTSLPATNVNHRNATLNGSFDPESIETEYHFEYGTADCSANPCTSIPSPDIHRSDATPINLAQPLSGLQLETTYHYRIVAINSFGTSYGEDQTFRSGDAVDGVSTDPPTNLSPTGADLNGSLDPDGIDTTYYFQYGLNTSYGQESEVVDAGVSPGEVSVTPADLSGLLEPTHTYHYRLVATNSVGTTFGQDRSFTTPSAPSIDAFSSSNVTTGSAELHTQINPEGSPTTYRFEYGPTVAYGVSAPLQGGEVGSGNFDEERSVLIENLEVTVYHFRVVAENRWGVTTSVDQTFSFYPEKCPNEARREETHSNFLPDCRAYELVSPSKQGSFIVFPGSAPAASYATNPARFSFGGGFGSVMGTNPPTNFNIDNYVSTRTDTGWVTKYAGIGGDVTLGASGMIGDLSFDKVIDFNEPNGGFGGGAKEPDARAPYVWSADGNSLGRWPASVDATPFFKEADENTLGAWQPSPDFTHLAFSSNNYAWETGGLTSAPGSAYDYNTVTGTTQIISILPGGGAIPQQPGQTNPQEWISFPGSGYEPGRPIQVNPSVSTDGSHILMATAGATGGTDLYMRVDDSVTYCVSCNSSGEPADVNYLGMTSDGSKVFFTSAEQLINGDTDHSIDLYMWSAATDSPTELSLGNNGGGNTDNCNPGGGWTSGCNVVPVVPARAYLGDTALAHESGDIYFYSPELLDGSKGIANQVNLYLYRGQKIHHVATFSPGTDCEPGEEGACGNGPIGRMDVSLDGRHMAFITNQRVTGYNNRGDNEMYSYDPSTDQLLCVSCDPSGAPPVGDVTGADNGLFMSNDGRAFFYSPDALVPQDTNGLHDVYEYVEGRPQLISSGTSAQDVQLTGNQTRTVGLAGVSADGANVYFSTFATLVAQDLNGPFSKYYDARSDGGFPAKPVTPPCEAADECHGAGSLPPPPAQIASAAESGAGGNWPIQAKRHKKRTQRRGRRTHRASRGHR